MTRLEVVFTMKGEISPPQHPLHLDALLAYARVKSRMDLDDPEALVGTDDLRRIERDLPLGLAEHDNDRVWMASALHYDGIVGRCSRFLVRKFDCEAFGRAVGSRFVRFGTLDLEKNPSGDRLINTGSGEYKNCQEFYPMATVRTIKAWCLGDQDSIEDLLAHITHLGPYRRNGAGEIASISVSPCSAELGDRWVRRIMPWQLPGYAKIYAACEAPYWAPENRREAWCPVDIGMI